MTTDTRNNQPPPASERLRSLPEPPTDGIRELASRARRDRLFLVIAALAITLGSIGAAIALGSRGEQEERAAQNARAAASADARASAAGDQAQAATDAAKEANRRLAALGKPTVPVPTVTISPPAGIPDGLTAQQTIAVRGVIAAELVRYHPNLTAAQVQQISRVAASLVPKPKDGKTPTAAELVPLAQAAQRAYCADGRCTPKPGADGSPGAQGSPGTAGKDAPAVTDEQLRPLIVSELTTYCQTQPGGTCKGTDGTNGHDGQDGRSVVDTDCVGEGSDSHWVVTYDRPLPGGATTQVRMGPCRLAPLIPDPSAARTK